MGQSVSLDHIRLRGQQTLAERQEVVRVHLSIAVHHRDEIVRSPHLHHVVESHRDRRADTLSTALQHDPLSGRFRGFDRLNGGVRGAVVDHDDQVDLGR